MAQLAGQSKRPFQQQLELSGQGNENTNGVLSVGSWPTATITGERVTPW